MLLKRSCETKKPIRVIRGYKLDSVHGPAEGYRYDGLYTVEDVRLMCTFGYPSSFIDTDDASVDVVAGLYCDRASWLQGLQVCVQGKPYILSSVQRELRILKQRIPGQPPLRTAEADDNEEDSDEN